MLIQLILVVAIGAVTVLLTRSTAGARHQAIRRLLLVGFVVVAVLAVLYPTSLTHVASFVGVGRGTDLLLYALVIAFVGYIATSQRRENELTRKITLLTRALALAQARRQIAGVDVGTGPGSTGDDPPVPPVPPAT